jgi:uncharacterized protein with HEPN domain
VKDDRLYLIHIHECIERIEQYTLGGKGAFLPIQRPRMRCSACSRL